MYDRQWVEDENGDNVYYKRGKPQYWRSFTEFWGRRGAGRFWKRRLSRARRRAWRDERHSGGLAGIESTCNWKNW